MGGAAVVYRHAAGLAALGHDVTVAAPKGRGGLYGVAFNAAVWARNALHRVENVPLFTPPGVTTIEPDRWQDLSAEGCDAVIATGHQTTPWVTQLTEKRTAQGIYFLQGDERDLSTRAGETWALPLERIAVSSWVAARVQAAGYDIAGIVPNAVDPLEFGVRRPIRKRPPTVVALYHRHPVKGPDVLVDALNRIREARPDARFTVISARPPRHRLPPGVAVEIRPARERMRDLFNDAAVCLHSSRSEGWALVPMEAAACGCAIAATASLGPREFLTPNVSMLEVPVGEGTALGEAAVRLLNKEALRIQMAEAAVRDVGRFSWEASTAQFERLLFSLVAES